MSNSDKPEKRQVKGTILQGFANMIKSNPDVPWEKYLTDEDMKVFISGVFVTGWYPFETFQRVGVAAFKEVAKENLEAVRLFGKMSMKSLVEGTYKSLAECKNVFEAFEQMNLIKNRFVSFAWPKFEKVGEKALRMTVTGAINVEGIVPFCYTMIGYNEFIIELYGGIRSRITLEKTLWTGDDIISVLHEWE